jgi:hypothetical protein
MQSYLRRMLDSLHSRSLVSTKRLVEKYFLKVMNLEKNIEPDRLIYKLAVLFNACLRYKEVVSSLLAGLFGLENRYLLRKTRRY